MNPNCDHYWLFRRGGTCPHCRQVFQAGVVPPREEETPRAKCDGKLKVGTWVVARRDGQPDALGTVVRHGRDSNGVYTEVQVFEGEKERFHRSLLREAVEEEDFHLSSDGSTLDGARRQECGCQSCRSDYGFSADEEEGPTCGLCGGPGVALGVLGKYTYYRCRNCGMDFSDGH